MKKLMLVLGTLAAALLACGGLFLACGEDGGPHCEEIVIQTCDPVCATGEICCGTTCKTLPTTGCMDVANLCTAPQYCDVCGTADPPVCVDPAPTCDPVCGAGQYCDGTTCKDNPVCSPACVPPEYCVP